MAPERSTLHTRAGRARSVKRGGSFSSQETSEEHRLLVRAEHVLHRGADLVQRAVGARAVEDEGHRVRRAAAGVAQGGEAALAERVVAARAESGEGFALLALGLDADLEQRDRQLRLLGHEVVHADDEAAVLLDLPLLA